MHNLGIVLLAIGSAYLIAVAVWTRGLIPFSPRKAAARGETYDHARAARFKNWHLLGAIVATLVGFWLTALR